jgi:hypothetical protein
MPVPDADLSNDKVSPLHKDVQHRFIVYIIGIIVIAPASSPCFIATGTAIVLDVAVVATCTSIITLEVTHASPQTSPKCLVQSFARK